MALREQGSHAPRRAALLLSAAFLALPLPAAAETETEVGVSLTAGADVTTLTSVLFNFNRAPDLFGLAPQIVGIGVDALAGDDRLTFTSDSVATASVAELRPYDLLPGPVDFLLRFLAPPKTHASAVGAAAGSGDDMVAVEGTLASKASALLEQRDADFMVSLPDFEGLISTSANVAAGSTGIDGGTGNDDLSVAGTLSAVADASGSRAAMRIDPLALAVGTQELRADALATGLEGGEGADRLAVADDATLLADAAAAATTVDISLEGVRLSNPESATIAEARAVAMSGGSGSDALANAGAIYSRADAAVGETGLALVVKQATLPGDILPPVREATRARADALGMLGGSGADSARNDGAIALDAVARHRQTGITFGDGGISGDAVVILASPPPPPEALVPQAGAIARVVGMAGDDWAAQSEGSGDLLVNAGTITGVADAEARVVSFDVGLPLLGALSGPAELKGSALTSVLDSFGVGLSDLSADAFADALGIAGEGGADRISNLGLIDLNPLARAQSSAITVSVLDIVPDRDSEPDEFASVNINLFNTATNAFARGTGIAGGDGQDVLQNGADAEILVDSRAETRAASLAVAAAYEEKALQIEAPIVLARSWSGAEAIGMSGGADLGRIDDRIENAGRIAATAEADAGASDVLVTVSLLNSGGAINAAITDTRVRSDASAIGMADDGGPSLIQTGGDLDATARAASRSTGVSVGLAVNSATGLSASGSFMASGEEANATARGISIGETLGNRLARVIAGGTIDAVAEADVARSGVAVNLGITNGGVTIAAPVLAADSRALADAAVLTDATARGQIVADGLLGANATARADASNVSVAFSGTNSGVGGGVTALLAGSRADARSLGLGLSGRADLLDFAGTLAITATADSRQDGTGVSLGGAVSGVGVAATLADLETRAQADATGISAGARNDVLALGGATEVDALAFGRSAGVGVAIGAVTNGLAVSAALARSGMEAAAHSTGIDLGDGSDQLAGDGAISVGASADGQSVDVQVALGGSAQGVAAGAALVETDSRSLADAAAVRGGAADDLVQLSGPLEAKADATSLAVGVAVSLEFAVAGVAGAGAGLFSTVVSDATATGIDGGSGADMVVAEGSLEVAADSAATRTAVSVAVSAAQGVAVGGTVVMADLDSRARATGLSGDGAEAEDVALGDEADALTLAGPATIHAQADATAVSVGVSGAVGVGFSAALLQAGLEADAVATALDGGWGDDSLLLSGPASLTALATARAPSVSFNLAGANIGRIDSMAEATATGLDGGDGDDALLATGAVDGEARASASGALVEVTLLGAALGRLGTTATADATGLSGGDGQDRLESTAAIDLLAESRTNGVLVDVALNGVAFPDASGLSEASARALAGGSGDDWLRASGPIVLVADAGISGSSVAATMAGASLANLETRADARAHALDGGDGADQLLLDGGYDLLSRAESRSAGIGISLLGVGLANATTAADASAFAVSGGAGADGISIGGSGHVEARAHARSTNVAVASNGVGALTPGLTVLATAGLGSGGGDADSLTNNGAATIVADASGQVGATNVTLAGAAITSFSGLVEAAAHGLVGDAGHDALLNSATLAPRANATLSAAAQRISVAGAALGSIATRAQADATGLAGGSGDDVAVNQGQLAPNATANASTTVVDVVLAGAVTGAADGTSASEARASGLDGGDGADLLRNDAPGAITATAATTGAATGVSVVLAGAGLADAGVAQTAHAIGIDGGAGADFVVNAGAVSLDARATGGTSIVNVTLAGLADGDVGVATNARVSGLLGEGGDDRLLNSGVLFGRATAMGKARNVQVTVAGALLGGADNRATATIVGLDGGAGDDLVRHEGSLDLAATASGSAGNTAVTVAGFGAASATSENRATAVGLSGGEGDDALVADGAMQLVSSASQSASGRSISILGAAAATGGLFATAGGSLLDGGVGDDLLLVGSGARLRHSSSASISASGATVNIAGSAATRGIARAASDLAALVGGSGNDDLESEGDVGILSSAAVTKSGSAFSLAGAATQGGDVRAEARATGMDGGDGDDRIANRGAMAVDSAASSTSGSSSFALAGFAGGAIGIGADATATGYSAGAGNNEMEVAGVTTVLARATGRLNSDVTVTFGATGDDRAPMGTVALARGLQAGSGADGIMLTGSLRSTARADTGFTSTKFVTVGTSGGNSNAVATATAIGVDSGAGNDLLTLAGSLVTEADATTNGNGAAGATIGNTRSASEAVARVRATGVATGAGVDIVALGGTSSTTLIGTARSINQVTSGALFSDGVARSRARTDYVGSILSDTGGSSMVALSGTHTLRIQGDLGNFRGLTRTDARSDGVRVGVTANAIADSRSDSRFAVTGLALGDGSHEIDNAGALTLLATPFVSSRAEGYGNSLISGWGNADAVGVYSASRVVGIEALAGTTRLENRAGALIQAEARPLTATAAITTATALNIGFDPDAISVSTARADNVTAIGVRLGGGADAVHNVGTIRAVSAPRVDRALARATGTGGGAVFSSDAEATSTASANNALAIGVALGTGANIVENDGLIEAIASPYAEARAESRGSGRDGDVISTARADALNARAIGVEGGAGADGIVNRGTITATSSPTRVRSGSATAGEWCTVFGCIGGSRDLNLLGSTSGEAVGIDTLGGDDLVVNFGQVNAVIGIRTGDGNDRVELRGGTVTGSVLLGNGDDVLRLQGGIMLGLADGGAGQDTLELTGAGFFGPNLQTGFENAIKTGPGTFNLRTMPGTGYLVIREGAIRLLGSSGLSGSHRLDVTIRPNGAHGALNFDSFTFGTSLGGRLTVEAEAGVYVNGTVWDVATAGTRFNGNFATVELPEPTALRSFSSGLFKVNGINRRYRVSVSVAPMADMVSDPLARSFAEALDTATPMARGEVATIIAGLQTAPTREDVVQAVQALTPRLPGLALDAGAAALDSGLAVLASRPGSIAGVGLMAPQGLSFESSGTLAAGGSWAAAFAGASGLSGGGLGEMTGFASGIATPLGQGARLHVGMLRSQSGHALPGAVDSGRLDQTLLAAGIATDLALPFAASPLAIEANVAAGGARFVGGRGVPGIGGLRSSRLLQDNRSMAASLDAALPFGPMAITGGVSWRLVEGAEARESLGEGLALAISGSRSVRAETHLGLSYRDTLSLGRLPLGVSLRAGWLHRLAGDGRIAAQFHAMPEHRFTLRTSGLARDALALDAALSLGQVGGFDLAATGMLRLGDETASGRPVRGLSLNLGRRF